MTPNTRSLIRYYAKDLTKMNRKRASLIIGGLFAGALIATACTATDTVEGEVVPEPTTVAPAAADYRTPAITYTPPVASADEDRFILLLESQDFNYGSSEALAIETGESVCGALDRNATIPSILAVIMGEGYGGYDAGTFLGASVYGLCPEYVSTVEDFLESVN